LIIIAIPPADGHGIGIGEACVIGQFDANLGVAVEGAKGFAAEMCEEQSGDIRRDLVVPVSGTSHGVDFATKILVPHFGEQFSLKIFLDLDGCGLKQGGHAWNRPGSDS